MTTKSSFEAYHGKSAAHHQARFDALAPHGWRMISLSVHGDPNDARYTAVWVDELGPAFVAAHGLPMGDYQDWFDDQVAAGFAPVLLSATGSGADAIVAAVFEQGITLPWVAKHGLVNGQDVNQNTIEYWNVHARQQRQILRSAAVYGVPSKREYLAVWHTQLEAHANGRTAETAQDHQEWFDAFQTVPLRPAFVAASAAQLHVSVYRDDSVGDWVARHGLSADDYQAEFDARLAEGLAPIDVHGSGVGDATRYAAIFARQHRPKPRQWIVTGAGSAGLDRIVRAFMESNGVRAGQLSVGADGELLASRAYTWADADYPVTRTGTRMRVASMSKMFTCAAMQALFDADRARPGDAAFAAAGVTTAALPTQTPDSRIDDITIQHLIDHEGGWDRNVATDWVFRFRDVAVQLGLGSAVSAFDLVRFVFGEPLQFTPGAKSVYSNIGYVTLTHLVERLSGLGYIDYLRDAVLAPAGIAGVELARTRRGDRWRGEAQYDDPNVGPSAVDPTATGLVGFCWGGEGWTTEAMAGSGGLAATADAMVRFIGRHAVWGMGGRAAGMVRTGSMAGVSSRAESRADGIDVAFTFNTRTLFGTPVNDLADQLSAAITSGALD